MSPRGRDPPAGDVRDGLDPNGRMAWSWDGGYGSCWSRAACSVKFDRADAARLAGNHVGMIRMIRAGSPRMR